MTDTDTFRHGAPIIEMSPDMSEIAKVLPKAQTEMGDVIKNASNPAFRSKYADLGAVIEATVPALNKHGIMVLQPTAFDGEMVRVGTMFLHESGQWIRCTLSIPPSKRDAHGIGSASTYGRRYSLLAMTGAAPEDDDANAASGPQTRLAPTPAPGPAITQDQADELQALAEDVGADMPKFLSYLRATSLAAIPASRFQDALAALEAKRQKAAA